MNWLFYFLWILILYLLYLLSSSMYLLYIFCTYCIFLPYLLYESLLTAYVLFNFYILYIFNYFCYLFKLSFIPLNQPRPSCSLMREPCHRGSRAVSGCTLHIDWVYIYSSALGSYILVVARVADTLVYCYTGYHRLLIDSHGLWTIRERGVPWPRPWLYGYTSYIDAIMYTLPI